MKKWVVLGLIFCLFLAHGAYLNRYSVQVISGELRASNPEGFYDYRGAFHVLSERSRESHPLTELTAAQQVGLDFIIFNDPLVGSLEPHRYLNGVLTIEGGSINYLDSSFLYIPAEDSGVFSGDGNAQVYLADLLSQAPITRDMDLVVLAHPFKPGFEWRGAYPSGLSGIEVINLRSLWQSSWLSSKMAFLWSVFVLPFNSELALLRLYTEPTRELQLWDELAQKRFTLGLAGAQTKSSRMGLGGVTFTFPTYDTSFGIISNHVLLEAEMIGEAERDSALILKGLQSGSVYMSLDILGDPKGFNALLKKGNQAHPMGSEVSLGGEPLYLDVTLPSTPIYPYEIVYWRNGEKVYNVTAPSARLKIEQPGVYRVQVRVIPTLPLPDGKKWTSWIFTNHFYVSP